MRVNLSILTSIAAKEPGATYTPSFFHANALKIFFAKTYIGRAKAIEKEIKIFIRRKLAPLRRKGGEEKENNQLQKMLNR
jgi:hypothetical protein